MLSVQEHQLDIDEDFPNMENAAVPIDINSEPTRTEEYTVAGVDASKWGRLLPWKWQNRKIFLTLGLSVFPISIFTASMVGLVFVNRIDDAQPCPYPNLCPKELDSTREKADYYVDYSSTRLIFVASWSSSVSFSVIGIFMTLLSYVCSKQIVDRSEAPHSQDTILPTPLQMSLLIRLLNAEFMGLLDIVWFRAKTIISSRGNSGSGVKPRTSSMVQLATVVFLISIIGR